MLLPPTPNRRTRLRAELAALWMLSWPILVGQVSLVAMNFADVAMTGHSGPDELAAVSLGSALFATVMVAIMGVMLAVNTLVAHEVGAGRNPGALACQAVWTALAMGLLGTLGMLVGTKIFDYLSLSAPVLAKARSYSSIVALGIPALAGNRALAGYTAGLHRTRPIMTVSLLGLGFIVFGNWVLIFGHLGLPALGSQGCAIATAGGLWFSLAALAFWIAVAKPYRDSSPWQHFTPPDWTQQRRILRLGAPIGITYFAEASAFSSVALLIAPFGAVAIGAHQIALNFSSLVFMFPMSLGTALITRIGHRLGEGRPREARFVAFAGLGASGGFALLSAAVIALGRHRIAALYSTDVAILSLAAQLLSLAALFQLSDATQVTAACAIRGYQVTRSPMIIHLASFWGVAVPIGCILGLQPVLGGALPQRWHGPIGFWIGLVAGLTVAAVLLVRQLARIARSRIMSPAWSPAAPQ